MVHPILGLELARARADILRADGGGPRRERRPRRARPSGRLRLAIGVRLVAAGSRLIGARVR